LTLGLRFEARGGADLTTRDGVFTLRYEYGYDPIDGHYNTVGGFVNVGFQLENLLGGESPFSLPEPVFRSPRDIRRLLGLKVKRNWHQATTPSAGWTCRLPGYAVLGYAALAMNVTYPATPALPDLLPMTASTIRLHWCGVLSSVDFCGVTAYSGNTVAAGGS